MPVGYAYDVLLSAQPLEGRDQLVCSLHSSLQEREEVRAICPAL